MSIRAVVMSAVLVMVFSLCVKAQLKIDFNTETSATQNGFIGISIPDNGGIVSYEYGTNNILSIKLTDDVLDDRDRGALTGGPGLVQSDLLRDFIFRHAGSGLGITLSILEAGVYTFTGFFHDNTVQQGTGKLGVDTGNGEVLKVASFTYSTGTAPAVVGTASFTFIADGTHPVTVYLRDLAGTSPYCINGFTLNKVIPQNVSETLVAYYDFENDLLDSSENDRHGSDAGTDISFLTDTPTALSDSSNSALFDGDAYVTLPYLGLYSNLASSNGVTVSLWIKSETLTGQSWFLAEGCTTDDNPAYLIGHSENADKPRALIRTSGASLPLDKVTDTATLYDSSWHHFVWTDIYGSADMYIDGVPVAAASGDWNYSHTQIPFDTTTLGAWIRDDAEPLSRKYPLIGLMDDVSIWSSVLSSNDIAKLYTGTVPRALGSKGGMSNVVFSTAQPYTGQTATYSASFIPAASESTNVIFNLSAFDTGSGNGMDLSAVSTSTSDYTFSGFTSDPTSITVDNEAKTVTFSGGTTVSNVMHTIEAVAGTSGWSIGNSTNSIVRFVNVQTALTEGETELAIIATLDDSELLAYYPFEDNFEDLTTNSLHGTNNGGVTFTSDTPADLTGSTKSGDFDGSSYVTLPYLGLYNELAAPGTEGLTVSLWIKSDNDSNAWFLGEGNTGNGTPAYCFGNFSSEGLARGFIRSDANNSVLAETTDTSATPSRVCDGEWHNWVWTDKNGEANMYIDGIAVPSTATSGEWNYTRSTLTLDTTTIGALIRQPSDSKYPYIGQIDDVSIWRTVLREQDIKALAAGCSPEAVIGGFDPIIPDGTLILLY